MLVKLFAEAKWPLSETHERVGEVRNVLKHKLILEEVLEVEHLAVEIWWYKPHLHYDYFESP